MTLRLKTIPSLLLALASAFAMPRAIVAQSPTTAAVKTPEPTAAHLNVALEVLRALDMERASMAGVEVSLQAQFGQNPAAAPYMDVARAWARKHMSWERMSTSMARLYASVFTEPELRELLAFYRTPLGRKLAEKTPELAQQGAAIGAEIAQANMAELQQMLAERQAELQKQASPPEG